MNLPHRTLQIYFQSPIKSFYGKSSRIALDFHLFHTPQTSVFVIPPKGNTLHFQCSQLGRFTDELPFGSAVFHDIVNAPLQSCTKPKNGHKLIKKNCFGFIFSVLPQDIKCPSDAES